MGTETNPKDEYQEDLFIKLSPEKIPARFRFQVSDNPDDLPPPPLMPADYNVKEK